MIIGKRIPFLTSLPTKTKVEYNNIWQAARALGHRNNQDCQEIPRRGRV